METTTEPKTDDTEAKQAASGDSSSSALLEHLLKAADKLNAQIIEELWNLYPKGAPVAYRTWHMKRWLGGVVVDVALYQGRPQVRVKPDHKPYGRWMPAHHVDCSNAELCQPEGE